MQLPISGILLTLGTAPLTPRLDLTLCGSSVVDWIYRPYFLPEVLTGLEEWHLPGGNPDRIAGSGIAPFSGIAASGTKTSETSQLDLVTLPQSLGNARQQNADDGLGLSLGKVDFVGNYPSEF